MLGRQPADLLGQYVRDTHAAYLPQVTPHNTICLHLGYPDPSTFPARDLAADFEATLQHDGAACLQYCEEAGDPVFRGAIAARYSTDAKHLSADDVVITQGTTEAIELVIRLFLNEGDTVLMEAPSYLWAIRAFRYAGARLVGVPTDSEGIRIDSLQERLASIQAEGKRANLLYLVPDFQNPQGVTMSLDRRKDLLAVAERNGIVILEDTPYFDLRYSGQPVPTLFDLDGYGLVLSARSFSKNIGPGIRLGWVTGPQSLIKNLVRMKQTGSCTLTSRGAARYISSPAYDENLRATTDTYRAKHDAMADALTEFCPAGIQWAAPHGGFYYWLKLPEHLDVDTLFEESKSDGVFFLKGRDFFCDGRCYNALRLSFSYESAERIRTGCKRLMSVIGRRLAKG